MQYRTFPLYLAAPGRLYLLEVFKCSSSRSHIPQKHLSLHFSCPKQGGLTTNSNELSAHSQACRVCFTLPYRVLFTTRSIIKLFAQSSSSRFCDVKRITIMLQYYTAYSNPITYIMQCNVYAYQIICSLAFIIITIRDYNVSTTTLLNDCRNHSLIHSFALLFAETISVVLYIIRYY